MVSALSLRCTGACTFGGGIGEVELLDSRMRCVLYLDTSPSPLLLVAQLLLPSLLSDFVAAAFWGMVGHLLMVLSCSSQRMTKFSYL